MNARVRLALIAITSAQLACHAVPALAAPQVISACGVISKPGSYVLDSNLTAVGSCLLVQSDFVTLDLAGFVIQGDGTGYGIAGLPGNHQGITVRNGTVTQFNNGITFGSATGVVIERMSAIDNGNVGIGGVTLLVKDSVAMGNLGTGISVGPRSLVSGSISNYNSTGIVTGPGSTVIGNTLGSNVHHGIAAGEGSTVLNNTSRNNPQFGIRVTCPSLVMGNTATANGTNLSLGGAGCTADHNVAP